MITGTFWISLDGLTVQYNCVTHHSADDKLRNNTQGALFRKLFDKWSDKVCRRFTLSCNLSKKDGGGSSAALFEIDYCTLSSCSRHKNMYVKVLSLFFLSFFLLLSMKLFCGRKYKSFGWFTKLKFSVILAENVLFSVDRFIRRPLRITSGYPHRTNRDMRLK